MGLCNVSRRSVVLLLAAFALPATAQTFDFPAPASACISVSNARYRVALPGEPAEYTVRLDPAAAAPDVRVQLTSSIDAADFVLVGDDRTASSCETDATAAMPIRTIRIDPAATMPDLTIGLVNDGTEADYRIYLRGGAIAPEAAAALFAAARMGASRPVNRIGSTALTLR